jgi:GxxExxY protein
MSRVIAIPDHVERTAKVVVDALFQVHLALGPGLLESVYETCVEEELVARGLQVNRQVAIPLQYRSRRVEVGFRADLIVERNLLIELKAAESLHPVHHAQVITYLKLTGIPLGLLVNMNVPRIRDGIHRLFNPSLAS